jgi:hypothetical protein
MPRHALPRLLPLLLIILWLIPALTAEESTTAPVITSATSASATVNEPFSYQITATQGPTSYGASGLPAGVTVDTSTGLISGTPLVAGTSVVTISASNAIGTGTDTLTLSTEEDPEPTAPPLITSPITASGVVGVAFSYQITATQEPTSFSATGLPAGLTIDPTTGVISGTPLVAGSSNVTVGASNGLGTGTQSVTFTMQPASTGGAPSITSATTASGTVGEAFTYTIQASNSPTAYSATGLPAGLSVNTGTGVISGTPTTAATSTVTLGASNSSGSDSESLTLTISADGGGGGGAIPEPDLSDKGSGSASCGLGSATAALAFALVFLMQLGWRMSGRR